MNAKKVSAGLAILAAILQTSILYSAQEEKGPESVTIDARSQGSVVFPHGRHQKVFVDCKPCHELFPKESQAIEKMKSKGILKEQAVMNMCNNCHQDLASKGLKSGPTDCKSCHQK